MSPSSNACRTDTLLNACSRITDLWELPDSLLTKSISAEIEHNFYTRCPPERRPTAFRDQPAAHSNPTSAAHVPTSSNGIFKTSLNEEMPGEKESQAGEERFPEDTNFEHGEPMSPPSSSKSEKAECKSKKIKQPKQDSSLLMALHATFLWQVWIAGLLKLASGTDNVFSFSH